MGGAAAQDPRDRGQGKGEGEADRRVGGEADARPLHPLAVEGRGLIGGPKDVVGHGHREIEPHAEQAEPGADLHPGQPSHGLRHLGDRGEDLPRAREEARLFPLPAPKGFEVFGRVLLCAHDGPEDRPQEGHRAQVERELHVQGDARHRPARDPDAKEVGHEPGEGRGHHRPQADEEALHGEAAGALVLGQEVGHESAEGLHAHVDGGVQDPEQAGRHPEGRGVGHEEERGGAEQGPGQEVGAPSSQPAPGAVAHAADDGLDEQTGEGRGEPEHRDLVRGGAQVLVDGAHVRHLQAPPELDAQEAEAHVPDLPEAQSRLVHASSSCRRIGAPLGRGPRFRRGRRRPAWGPARRSWSSPGDAPGSRR